MTVLQMLWCATIVGAFLFFVAGFLLSAARRSRREPVEVLGWTPPQERPDGQLAEENRRQAGELASAVAALRERDEALRAGGAKLQHLEGESAAARGEASALRAQLASAGERAESAGRLTRDLERARDQAFANRDQAFASLEQARANLEEANGALSKASERAKTSTGASDEAKTLRADLRERKNEVGVLRRRVEELEAMRAEYLRLRTQRDEEQHLRGEVARLSAALDESKRPPRPPSAIRKPEPIARPKGPASSMAESLQRCVNDLVDTSVWAAVVADRVGFPITSVGDDGAALAAYSTLLAEAGERAHSFFSVSSPQRLVLVDHDNAHVTLWPFVVDEERLSLVTLSSSPVDEAKALAAVDEIERLLSRTRAPRSIAN